MSLIGLLMVGCSGFFWTVSENGLEDNAYPGLPRPTSSAAELKESHVQVQEVDDAGRMPYIILVGANNIAIRFKT